MLAIIPAREGSKGLPGKNIMELHGKPLIAYAIEEAKKSKHIRRVVVSTDSKEIAEVALKYGAEIPFLRPENLATDSAKAIDTYFYTIEKLEKDDGILYNEFIVLQPTSPLRTVYDIDSAIETFKLKNADSLISFSEMQHPPEWAKKIQNNEISDYFPADDTNKNRQEYHKAFLPNGAIYIFKYSVLKKRNSYYTENTVPYLMPVERSIDIDTESDFRFAEFLLQNMIKENRINEKLEDFIAEENVPVHEAIKKLDKGGMGILCISDKTKRITGIITDGDFRRSLLQGENLKGNVSKIANANFVFLRKNYSQGEVFATFNRNSKIQHIPVLDENNRLCEIICKDNFSQYFKTKILPQIPVVIMAGGKGTRMEPFSTILPKPLLPIGEKPVIEIIIENYRNFGVKEFFISVNYKANILKAYLENSDVADKINYIEEEKPLGTAGALKFLESKINSPFFVSNCDIIIKDDYTEIYKFHNEGNFDLTIVASLQYHKIPYGVCKIKEGGELTEITEKPEYNFLVNTGMYLLNPDVLILIPENTFYNITDLIDSMKKSGRRVGVYPVSERSYLDVGQWGEYKNVLKILND